MVGERVANEQVVRRVGAAGERAESRRNPSDLDIDRFREPRPDARVKSIGLQAVAVFSSHLDEKRKPLGGSNGRDQIDADHSKRRVFVVGVVEEPGVVRADTARRDFRVCAAKVAETSPPSVTRPPAKLIVSRRAWHWASARQAGGASTASAVVAMAATRNILRGTFSDYMSVRRVSDSRERARILVVT